MPGTGGEDVIDLNCAAHSAPPGLVEAYQRATEQLPAYLGGPGYFPLGVPALQTRIAAAYDARGLPTVPEQVMVTAGALAAASVVAQAFTAPGERVVVESPTYPNATQAVRHAGARLVAATVDPDGWDLDALAATLRQTSPRLAYLIPDFQNPTGHLMSDSQREELAHALRPHPHDASSSTRPTRRSRSRPGWPTTCRGRSRPTPATRSRSAAPASRFWGGLRLGWVRAPLAEMDRLLQARIGLDLGAPVLRAAGAGRPARPRRRGARRSTASGCVTGRDALVAAVREHLPTWRFRRARRRARRCGASCPRRSARATTGRGRASRRRLSPRVRCSPSRAGSTVRADPVDRPPDDLTEAVRRLAAAWERVPASRPDAARTGSAVRRAGRVMVA